MENSILKTVKKTLGFTPDYTAFDLDLLVHINSTFTIINEMGIGPDGFTVEDDTKLWTDLLVTPKITNLVKTYVYLKVRKLFDPPGKSFHSDATERLITEYEWRLNNLREVATFVPRPEPVLLAWPYTPEWVDGGAVAW